MLEFARAHFKIPTWLISHIHTNTHIALVSCSNNSTRTSKKSACHATRKTVLRQTAGDATRRGDDNFILGTNRNRAIHALARDRKSPTLIVLILDKTMSYAFLVLFCLFAACRTIANARAAAPEKSAVS